MVIVETGEGKSFEIVCIKPDIYSAEFVRDEAYEKEGTNRLKLFFEVEIKEEEKPVIKELMFTCPFPVVMTENTKLGSILKLLGLNDFSPHAKIDTSAFHGKSLRIIVKDWSRIEDGKQVVSSQITDFM